MLCLSYITGEQNLLNIIHLSNDVRNTGIAIKVRRSTKRIERK